MSWNICNYIYSHIWLLNRIYIFIYKWNWNKKYVLEKKAYSHKGKCLINLFNASRAQISTKIPAMIVHCKRPRRVNTSTIKGIYVQFKSDLKSLVKAAVDGCGWLRRATYAVVYRKRGRKWVNVEAYKLQKII